MLKSASLVTAVCALAMIPVIAYGQAASSCWLKDGSAPTATTAFILCEQGPVYITNDGGATWRLQETGAKDLLRAIVFSDASHGIAVGNRGTIVGTDDGGKTWQPRNSGSTENLLSVTGRGNLYWASGFNGALVTSTDGGRTWSQQKTGITQGLEDIYFADAQHGWAVGWSGTILRTDNGGAKWDQVTTKVAQWSLTSVTFTDAKNGWATGFAGQLLRSTDGGLTWTAVNTGINTWYKDVFVDGSKRIWVAADDQFLVSEDNGAKFRSVPASTQAFLRKFVPVGDKVWAIGQLALLSQSGTEWKKITSLIPRSPGASLDPDALAAANEAAAAATAAAAAAAAKAVR